MGINKVSTNSNCVRGINALGDIVFLNREDWRISVQDHIHHDKKQVICIRNDDKAQIRKAISDFTNEIQNIFDEIYED